MASTINATGSGIVLTGSTSAALNLLVGGSAAISIGTGATLSISNPSTFPAGSASAPAITTTGDTNTGVYFPAADQVAVTAGGTVAASFNTNGLFFRNRIINGDMRIDQRNAGASVSTTTAGNYITDRFYVQCQTNGNLTGQQSTTVPNSTFKNSLVATVSSAAAPTGVNDITHRVEGFNVADFGFGAAGAQTVTVSFWARSSVTGTYSISFASVGSGSGRWYVTTYSLTANTWTKITIVVPGDTSGTWNTTTSTGFQIYWSLGTGSTYQTSTLNSWQTGTNLFAATTETAWCNNAGATFYITGVQLETGSVATPFERRPYGTELMLCQRYCQKLAGDTTYTVVTDGWQSTTTSGNFTYCFGNPMRAQPTLTTGTVGDFYARNGSIASALSTLTLDTGVSATKESVSFAATWAGAGGSNGFGAQLVSGATAPKVLLTAEL